MSICRPQEWALGFLGSETLSLGLGAQEPWAHAAGMPGWNQGQDSQTMNVAVKGMASLVCGPLGCEAQAGRECLGAPV